MNKRGLLILFLIFIPIISADLVSVNFGGSNNLVIEPGTENFFVSTGAAVCSPVTCSLLNYNCGNWSNGCGGNIDCGNCSSGYACNSGICTTISGGAGGAGVGAVTNIIINPMEIKLSLSFNNVTHMAQRVTEKIYITNNGTSTQILPISQHNLDGIIYLGNTSITIAPGQTIELQFDLVAPLQEENVIGSVQIGNQKVSLSLQVTSNPFWFDSNIVVLNRDYKVSKGTQLKTKVTLIPMGAKEKIDVTLNYIIKDASGKIYLQQSETVLVEGRMDLTRNFNTGILPLGNYIIESDLVYPNGMAISSAQFKVVQQTASDFFTFLMFTLIVAIVIVSIVIVALSIIKRR